MGTVACRDAHNHNPRKPVGGIPSRSAHGRNLPGVDEERQGKKELCAAFSSAPQGTKAIKPEAQSWTPEGTPGRATLLSRLLTAALV